MAGSNQHYIPRSLQRGFLFDVKAEHTYVYRRHAAPFANAIDKVAVQRYFYSCPSEDESETLDDLITNYEKRLGQLLINLRDTPIDEVVDACVAAEAIAHLTPRGAHVRHLFGGATAKLLNAAAEAFSNADVLARMSGLSEPEPNPTWHGFIEPALDKEPLFQTVLASLPIPRRLVDRMIFMMAKEFIAGGFDAMKVGITAGFASLMAKLADVVRGAHTKTLARGMVAEGRRLSLEELEWHIRAAPAEGAILPDCVALGLAELGGPFLPYMMTSVAVKAVVMPITSEKLLVGVRPGSEAPDLANFNRDASACSAELFIAASRAPVFEQLRVNMGACWMAEVEDIVQGALNSVLPNQNSTNQMGRESPPSLLVSYQLTFIGFDSKEEVGLISEKTQTVLSHLQHLFDLERLDGITFAEDPQGAHDALERGFDVDTIPESIPDHIAQGVATALVLRDGVAKIRLVMHAAYGRALIADEPRDAEVALHFLVAGLVQVCTLSRHEKELPAFLLEPGAPKHDSMLYGAVRKAIRAYRYARDSAGFGADDAVEQEFSKYVTAIFDGAASALSRARIEHAASPDFHKLFNVALDAASGMLISLARLLGHHHGTGRMELSIAENEVHAVLAARQLLGWVDVFSKDLQHFWQKEKWERSDFYALNIHVERVLWANGIFLWPDPHGEGTMVMAGPESSFPTFDMPQ